MILPIYAYGSAVLRKETRQIEVIDDEIKLLIENMWDTMYNANGIGLAAPQVGHNLRLFMVDAREINEDGCADFKHVFINAEILEETGEEWNYEEGCLSIPQVRADVSRKPKLKMRYMDENMMEHVGEFDGMPARIIQHEYDHIEGILFTDKIHNLKKAILKSKLQKITEGKLRADYKMRFPR